MKVMLKNENTGQIKQAKLVLVGLYFSLVSSLLYSVETGNGFNYFSR